MLDVVDFIRFTTSPTARKAMLARKGQASGPHAAQAA
jgi:hypothetical protein